LEFLFLWFFSVYSTISSVLLWKSLWLFHKVVFGMFHNLSLTMKEVNSFTQNSVRWNNCSLHKIHDKDSFLLKTYVPVEICEKESLLYCHETSQNLIFYLFRRFLCKIGIIHTLKWEAYYTDDNLNWFENWNFLTVRTEKRHIGK
jgi:hypothetical protein